MFFCLVSMYLSTSQTVVFPKIIFPKFDLVCCLYFVNYLGVPKPNIIVFGVMVTSARSENHENDGFSAFPKMNPNSY